MAVSQPHRWVLGPAFLLFFSPHVSMVHQTHTLGKPPIISDSSHETPKAPVFQSQRASGTLLLMYWPKLKTWNSDISDQLLPVLSKLPFPVVLPSSYPGCKNFLHPLSLHLNPSCLATCQFNNPLHGPCSGMNIAHRYQS